VCACGLWQAKCAQRPRPVCFPPQKLLQLFAPLFALLTALAIKAGQRAGASCRENCHQVLLRDHSFVLL
jgi:hypothetical protein